MTAIIDQTLATLDELQFLITAESDRRYQWTPAEDAELRHSWGKMPRQKLADRITAILRRQTGDPNVVRTIPSLDCRHKELGIPAYNGEPGEMSLIEAARWLEVDYYFLHKAAIAKQFPTIRRGKQRYVTQGDLSSWYVDYRDRLETRAEVLDATAGPDFISKKEAMELLGLSETHIHRYLSTGVIMAFILPTLTGRDPALALIRGEWRVSRQSCQTLLVMRTTGRLSEYLSRFPAYLKQRQTIAGQIRRLRRQGRLEQQDPLTQPKSKYHPGCFTIAQLASHLRLSTFVLYNAIRRGELQAQRRSVGGRNRYAVSLEQAQHYKAYLKTVDQTRLRLNHNRYQIRQAGLLTLDDLSHRWDRLQATIYRYLERGYKNQSLPYRKWGRYIVFEPSDIERFEQKTGIIPLEEKL